MHDDECTKSLHEQSRAYEEYESERNFRDNKDAAQAMPRTPCARTTSALFQRFTDLRPRMEPRWRNPRDNAADDSDGQRKEKCVCIEAYRIPASDELSNFRRHIDRKSVV